MLATRVGLRTVDGRWVLPALMAGAAGIAAAVLGSGLLVATSWLLASCATVIFFAARPRKTKVGALVVDDRVLAFDGNELARREHFLAATSHDKGGASLVVLTMTDGRTVEMLLARADVQPLLQALGLADEEAAVEARLHGKIGLGTVLLGLTALSACLFAPSILASEWLYESILELAPAWLASTHSIFPLSPAASETLDAVGLTVGVPMVPLLLGALVAAARGGRVFAGAEGLLVKTVLGTTFHRYETIHSIDAEGGTLYVLFRNGARKSFVLARPEEAAITAERVSRGMARATRSTSDEAPHLLGRAGRLPIAWIRAIAEMQAREAAAYRTGLPPEKLWSVLEDPKCEPSVRVGAGLALRGALDEGSRRRLRVVAASSALPQVRVALEAVACDADDLTLASAVAEVA